MNEVGGEDDLLFGRIKAAKGKFAWAPSAMVYEYPLPQRIRLTYTLRRAFAYGQGPCTLARRSEPARYDKLAMWILWGGAKFGLHASIWAALRLLGHKNRAFEADKAIRGLGKVLFWKRLRFYGTSTVTQLSEPVLLNSDNSGAADDTRLRA